MAKFSRRAIEVEAVQWTGTNEDEIVLFIGDGSAVRNRLTNTWVIHYADADRREWVLLGDWIVKEENEIHTCEADIFPTRYEPAQGVSVWGAEDLARRFHEVYERLAPSFGYVTRKESAVPWEQVPENNRNLMVAVAMELFGPRR